MKGKRRNQPNVTLDNTRDELTVHLERAFLVSVALPDRPWIGDDPLEELRGLATTAGAVVVGGLLPAARSKINPATYIGKGKLDELQEQVEAADADVVIFDNDLSPAQVRNLEKATNVKVLDRSELILDIFATRARSVEARLQVELAQLEYSLPRLRQMWTPPVAASSGGIGTARPRRNAARRGPPARRPAHPRPQGTASPRCRPARNARSAAAARSTPSRWSATPTPARAR